MMNLFLNYDKEFEKYLVRRMPKSGGIHYQFKFDNNYGASVIKHDGSYGRENDLWELAVIRWRNLWSEDYYYDLVYDTDIADGVLGYLTDENINEVLKKIKAL